MVPSPNASAGRDLLVGIDAGTSVIKAVAFDLAGRQIAVASVPNRYTTNADGAAFQSWTRLGQTARRRFVISAPRSKTWRGAQRRWR
jgi:erythritol kinase